jgi:hypothetical protein
MALPLAPGNRIISCLFCLFVFLAGSGCEDRHTSKVL